MSEQNCENCRFFVHLLQWDEEGEKLAGFCRRYPPLANEHECIEVQTKRWPLTLVYDWCGEWQPAVALVRNGNGRKGDDE